MKCGECPHFNNGSIHFDYRSLSYHERCTLADREFEHITYGIKEHTPDWCPIKKGEGQVKEMKIEKIAVELEKAMEHTIHLWQTRKIARYLLENGWRNDIKPTEDCQHSENKPQEKCQFVPETPNIPDYIAGFAVSDLLFIAQIVGGNPHLIEQIKDGYAFGHAVGYEAGIELFEKKVHEAISKIAAEPIRLEKDDGFDFTKVKFEIPPYKQQDEVINMARLYGVSVTAPKVINVVNPSTDGDENK